MNPLLCEQISLLQQFWIIGSAVNANMFQILIATSTLAWGVNFPAHLVVIKGTEYFDGKTRRYVDFPITGTYMCNRFSF